MRTWSITDVFGLLAKVEKLTRPSPRRAGFDEEVGEEFRREGGDLANWERELLDPDFKAYECMACGERYSKSGGHECPTLADAKLEDMEAEMDRQTAPRLLADDPALGLSGAPSRWSLDELFKLKARIDGARWGEPPLSASEIVGVRQMLEERFGDAIGMDGDMTSASVKLTPGTGAGSTSPAAGPAAPAGESGEEAGQPPVPASSPRPDLATWLEPAIQEVFANHTISRAPFGQSFCTALDGSVCDGNWDDDAGWYDHVTYELARHIAQALPDYPEPVPASPHPDFALGIMAAFNIVADRAKDARGEGVNSPSARLVAHRLDDLAQELLSLADLFDTKPQK